MNVTIKLVAMNGLLPTGFDEWGVASVSLPEGITVSEAVDNYTEAKGSGYLVLLNGSPLPPEERVTHLLTEGDELNIFPPIHGG